MSVESRMSIGATARVDLSVMPAREAIILLAIQPSVDSASAIIELV